MPYLLISTQIRMEGGNGEKKANRQAGRSLVTDAAAVVEDVLSHAAQTNWEYYVNDAPRIVLNKLESCGYRVVSMTGVGQTLVWCLHKE
ncbi:GTP cyclohydrolase 1 feedback regulatory protein isoform X2 [Ciconia boyciana]|uniref:GTP cyclohydrolase 1 feedback regulatory protein isoform X2 n=1 Tax=Ciconia boyciana TaxID=52775 RepID=UPI003BA344B2